MTASGVLQVKWLPFQDRVDWSSIAIIVHRDQMATIPTLVKLADIEVRKLRTWASLLPCALSNARRLCVGKSRGIGEDVSMS